MQVHCLYGVRKYKTRVKTELRKQQYTVTLFDRNHLAHSIVLQLYEKCNYYCVNVQFLLSCIFLYFQVRAPGGLYLKGPFKGGFFAFTSFFMGGGGGLEGLILRNFTVLLYRLMLFVSFS